MYVAYYILKHKLIGEAMNEYLAKVIKEWKSLIDTYSDEEIVCANRPEA